MAELRDRYGPAEVLELRDVAAPIKGWRGPHRVRAAGVDPGVWP